MRDRKPKRERAREPEAMPTAEADRVAPQVPPAEYFPAPSTWLPPTPPATWADVAMESARASRAAAEAASDIARTGHPEGVELVSQDEGLLRADTSRREVEWLRARLVRGEQSAQRGLDAMRSASVSGGLAGEHALEEWLAEPKPDWHIDGPRQTVGEEQGRVQTGDELAFRPIEGPGRAFNLRRGDVLRVSIAGSPVFVTQVMSVAWRNEAMFSGVEVGLARVIDAPLGHGIGYVTVDVPPADSIEHFQRMAKGQQKRAARLSEALAHMTSLHTKGKRAAVKMQKRISALQTALEEERMRADRAEGACERLGNARTAAVEEYRSTRAELDRLMTVDPVANAQAAIDAEREQKDRVARYLREMITQAIGQNEAALDGRGRLRLASETLRAALRDSYNPDEIPF